MGALGTEVLGGNVGSVPSLRFLPFYPPVAENCEHLDHSKTRRSGGERQTFSQGREKWSWSRRYGTACKLGVETTSFDTYLLFDEKSRYHWQEMTAHPEGHCRMFVGDAVDWAVEWLGLKHILGRVHVPSVGGLVGWVIC